MRFALIMLLISMWIAFETEQLHAQSQRFDLYASKSKIEGRIGALINVHGIVSKVHYRSPAQLNGMRDHDQILAVNFRPFKLSEIQGAPGERLVLLVRHDDDEMAVIEMQYIDYRDIDYKTDPNLFYMEKQIVDWGENS